jgi:hypothetical protein
MNTIGGRVVLKESGVGIPNLLVVLTSANSAATPVAAVSPPPPPTSMSYGTVSTDQQGALGRRRFPDIEHPGKASRPTFKCARA